MKRDPHPSLPATIDKNQRYTVLETNGILRQSNAQTYKQIAAGELRVLKQGRRTYIPGSELIRLATLP